MEMEKEKTKAEAIASYFASIFIKKFLDKKLEHFLFKRKLKIKVANYPVKGMWVLKVKLIHESEEKKNKKIIIGSIIEEENFITKTFTAENFKEGEFEIVDNAIHEFFKEYVIN